MRIVIALVTAVFILPLIIVITVLISSYHQHVLPVESTATTVLEPSQEVFDFYAKGVLERLVEGNPVVMVVPLNGTPVTRDHISYKNAFVALEVLERIPGEEKYLLLSEGNTASACRSGAAVTAELLEQVPGFNEDTGVTVILEENAATTVENVLFTRDILEELFPDKSLSIIVAGMHNALPPYQSSLGSRSPVGLDVGHGARAFLLFQQMYLGNSQVQLAGMLPTNRVDATIQNYPFSYNILTMIAGALGGLYLPYFDREEFQQQLSEDGC